MQHHSRSELFLTELLLSLLILSIAAAACVQVFAAATAFRTRAGEWNHIRELTVTAGELLKGLPADPDAFSDQLPGGKRCENELVYTYDLHWQLCSEEKACYRMYLTFTEPDQLKIRFTKASGKELCTQTLLRPDLHTLGEVIE